MSSEMGKDTFLAEVEREIRRQVGLWEAARYVAMGIVAMTEGATHWSLWRGVDGRFEVRVTPSNADLLHVRDIEQIARRNAAGLVGELVVRDLPRARLADLRRAKFAHRDLWTLERMAEIHAAFVDDAILDVVKVLDQHDIKSQARALRQTMDGTAQGAQVIEAVRNYNLAGAGAAARLDA